MSQRGGKHSSNNNNNKRPQHRRRLVLPPFFGGGSSSTSSSSSACCSSSSPSCTPLVAMALCAALGVVAVNFVAMERRVLGATTIVVPAGGTSSSSSATASSTEALSSLWSLMMTTEEDGNNNNNNNNNKMDHQQEVAVVVRTSSTSLAAYESFGYFTDIPDDDWRRRQHRARSHQHQIQQWPSQREIVSTTDPARWYMLNYYPLFTCPHQERVGGPGDGPKWVCDPHRLANKRLTTSTGTGSRTSTGSTTTAYTTTTTATATSPSPQTPPCLVYSIGSQGNYAFEDGLVDRVGVGTCEIHVFDVANDYGRPNDGVERHIHFHHVGLKSSYSDLGQMEGKKYWTLRQTLQELGHVNRTIDIFKIDCEHCEWTTYKDWIEDGTVDIRQLLLETHGISNVTRPDTFLNDVQNAGFAMFSKEVNSLPVSGGRCVEWSFIKLRKSFFQPKHDPQQQQQEK